MTRHSILNAPKKNKPINEHYTKKGLISIPLFNNINTKKTIEYDTNYFENLDDYEIYDNSENIETCHNKPSSFKFQKDIDTFSDYDQFINISNDIQKEYIIMNRKQKELDKLVEYMIDWFLYVKSLYIKTYKKSNIEDFIIDVLSNTDDYNICLDRVIYYVESGYIIKDNILQILNDICQYDIISIYFKYVDIKYHAKYSYINLSDIWFNNFNVMTLGVNNDYKFDLKMLLKDVYPISYENIFGKSQNITVDNIHLFKEV